MKKTRSLIYRISAFAVVLVLCIAILCPKAVVLADEAGSDEQFYAEQSILSEGAEIVSSFEEDAVLSEDAGLEVTETESGDTVQKDSETDEINVLEKYEESADPVPVETMDDENTVSFGAANESIKSEEEGTGSDQDTELKPNGVSAPVEKTESEEDQDFKAEPEEAVAEEEKTVEKEEEIEALKDQAQETEPAVLSKGMSGEEVLKMQKALYDLGFLNAGPDGIFGNYSERAVKKFQMYNSLPVTGTVDETVKEILYGASPVQFSALQYGSRGNHVRSFQTMLSEMGYLSAAPDGIFGNYTKQAVIAFQADNGIGQDGVAGRVTIDRLFAEYASPSSDDRSGKIDKELSIGMSGEEVMALQTKLKKLGFLSVNPDGMFGGYTERAVKKFQMYNAVEPTGVADLSTISMINSSGTGFYNLSKGLKDKAVLGLQRRLKELGYLSVNPDGIFGNYSQKAVESFQKANGISPQDGIAGRLTAEKLFNNPVTMSDYRDKVVVEYGGTYYIITALGSKAVDVTGASVSEGANIQLYAGNQSSAQKWVMQSAGGDYYYIRNLKSWKCLDAVNGNVQQSEGDPSSPTQKWKIVKNEAGGYNIVNSNGAYLTVSSGEDSNGSNIAATGDQGAGSRWNLEEATANTALNFKTDGVQYIGFRQFKIDKGNVTETTGYYNINTSIDLPSGGYNLSAGSNYSIGLKVMYVNNFLVNNGYLSWDYYNYSRYDSNTAWAVKQFQSHKGIGADGIVGIKTWKAMGYSENDFYNLGSYVTPLKVYAYGSSRGAYVQAMLNTASEYASSGTGFLDGASGKPGSRVDCSGLIYQCLYAAGINPDTNIIDHARVLYEFTSAYLGSDWKLGQSVSNPEPGDLVFYGSGSINHVAIYAGNGMIYDSWPGVGVTYRSMYAPGNILKIVRVF